MTMNLFSCFLNRQFVIPFHKLTLGPLKSNYKFGYMFFEILKVHIEGYACIYIFSAFTFFLPGISNQLESQGRVVDENLYEGF